MSDEDDEGGEEGGGGAPGWIMTFADLMSLLLAFFVLLFSFSSIDDKKYKEIGGSLKVAFGVQRQFEIFDKLQGINHIAAEFSSGKPDPKIVNVIPQQYFDDNRPYIKKFEYNQDGGSEQNDKQPSEQESKELQESQKDTAAQMAEIAAKEVGKVLAEEVAQGQLEIETEGNKLIIRVKEEPTFPPGSAQALTSLDPILKKISDAVGSSPGRIVVEGHSDNVPISTPQFASNWELSSARAATIVRAMIAQKQLPPERFEVRGLADTRPVASNDTPRDRSKNRRVDIVIEFDALNQVPENLKDRIQGPAKISGSEVKPIAPQNQETEQDQLFSSEDFDDSVIQGDLFSFH